MGGSLVSRLGRIASSLRRRDPTLLLLLPVVGFVVAFTLLPVAVLFADGLSAQGGFGAIGTALADPITSRAIENSVWEGAASAAAAIAVGYPAGVFLGRNRFRGRSVLLALLLVPFLLPTVVVVVGVEELFASGGLLSGLLPALQVFGSGFGGIVATNVVFNAPVVVLLTVVGIEGAPRGLEETVASLGGSPWRSYRTVWARPSWVGALAGGLLTFLFSALAFASPILIGGPSWYTIEARVWSLDQNLAEPGAAAVLAFVSVLLLAVPTIAYLLLAARLRSGGSPGGPAAGPADWRNPATLATGAVTAVSLGTIALLLALVVARAFAPLAPGDPDGSALTGLFSSAVTARLGISAAAAIGNTILFAALASAIAVVLAITAGHAVARRSGSSRVVGGIAFAPLLVSPVVLSFALSELWLAPLGGAAAVGVLIIVSQATLALPFALQGMAVSLSAVPAAPREAAQSLGASPWRAYLDVELPMAAAGLRTAALFAFALGLGEFTATNFLATAPTTTLSVMLYRLEEVRRAAYAQSVAGLLVLLSLAAFLLIAAGGGRRADVL
jgi:thiamine transport system permease protein